MRLADLRRAVQHLGVAFYPHCGPPVPRVKCAARLLRVSIRDKDGMNTQHRSRLKHKLLAGVALAIGAASAQAGQLTPYFYTWAFDSGNTYVAKSLAAVKSAGVNAVTLAFGTAKGSSCAVTGFEAVTGDQKAD